MKCCDICGKKDVHLTDLRDIYRTDLIAELCPDCEYDANQQLSKLQTAVMKIQIGWLKRWLTNRREYNGVGKGKQQ